ncbi:Os06g0532301 [Oryza sativa Japonica Group]|uniref:Os06g0532301 protein n=1 Tax=Oryza sativa subsp. japonica TaxID=39947 RepID=A0A0P0WXM7_ORYSJ|nr:hypothetical protein EE612_034641 [Oryza sativa]BAS98072.1 Os06g0532301 [Oryza sativa Japonica Group]
MSNSGVLKGLSKFSGVYREFSQNYLCYQLKIVVLKYCKIPCSKYSILTCYPNSSAVDLDG